MPCFDFFLDIATNRRSVAIVSKGGKIGEASIDMYCFQGRVDSLNPSSPHVFAQQGIWYDAVTSLAQLSINSTILLNINLRFSSLRKQLARIPRIRGKIRKDLLCESFSSFRTIAIGIDDH
jgi:hypothetical protein